MSETTGSRLTIDGVPPFFFVFDGESVGLHGDVFAFGYVIVDSEGQELVWGGFQCPTDRAAGSPEGRAWIKANVPDLPLAVTLNTRQLRTEFWRLWDDVKQEWPGIVMAADCAWPVEARFLIDCVDDDPETRTWEGPYPLHDIASVIMAHGGDPMQTRERLDNERPAHNPVCDARQSARLLIEALRG